MQSPAEQGQGLHGTSPTEHGTDFQQGSPPGAVVGRAGDRTCVRELADGARIQTGNAGDHQLVLDLLVLTRQAPLAEDFQSRLDEPTYRPSDRLLVRRHSSLLAHVHLASHIAWFEGQRVPIVKFEDFAALPEYSQYGYEAELLTAAESIAASEGAVVALAYAHRPALFEQHGWSMLRGQGHTRANAPAVLAHLDAQDATRRRRKPTIGVRTWRHFELDVVRQTYEQCAAELWGPLYRSEACWQWLVGRKAQDQILLAIHPQKSPAGGAAAPLASADSQVVGYAIVRGSCIIEMMTLPEFTSARMALLSRACRDAIDRDHHWISLYTPAADPLHELLVTVGGAWISNGSTGEPKWLMKFLSPEKWVERLYALWHDRARYGGVARPFDLAVCYGKTRAHFTLTRRSARLQEADAGQAPVGQIDCDRPTFHALLFGNLTLGAAVANGQLKASGADLPANLATLFPPRLFWQSPLELMRL